MKKKYEQLALKDKQRYERENTAYKAKKGTTKGKKAIAAPADESDEEEEEDSDDE